jgi:hypothetical protein
VARGKAPAPARAGLAGARYALSRQFHMDVARALGDYDQRALTPLRLSIEYLMLPWWKRLFAKRPDVRDLYWYETVPDEEA